MFVVKFSICIAIVLICTILGITKSKRYEIRQYMLQDFITVFKSIENDIKYMLISLPDALEKARHGLSTSIKDTLGSISVDMLSSNDIGSINKKINEDVNNIAELTFYDKEVIYYGLANLGKADVESQISIIKSTLEALSSQLDEASIEKEKNFKLYRSLGTAIGLVIAIVFI